MTSFVMFFTFFSREISRISGEGKAPDRLSKVQERRHSALIAMLALRRFHYRHPYLITLFQDRDEYCGQGERREPREQFFRLFAYLSARITIGMGHKVEDTYPTRTESRVMKKNKKKKNSRYITVK
jgi:hypothetical protein